MRAVVGLEAGREGEEPLRGEVRLPCLGRMSLEGRRPLTGGGWGHERPVKEGHLLVGEPLVASQRRDRPAAAAPSALGGRGGAPPPGSTLLHTPASADSLPRHLRQHLLLLLLAQGSSYHGSHHVGLGRGQSRVLSHLLGRLPRRCGPSTGRHNCFLVGAPQACHILTAYAGTLVGAPGPGVETLAVFL